MNAPLILVFADRALFASRRMGRFVVGSRAVRR